MRLQFFLWCLIRIELFVLLVCPFSGLSAFVQFFFWSVPTDVSGLLTSPAPNLRYLRQKKSGNSLSCCSLGPEVPSQFAFSLYISEFYVCFIYTVQGFSCI